MALAVGLLSELTGVRANDSVAGVPAPGNGMLAPVALAASSEGALVYVAAEAAQAILVVETASGQLRARWSVPGIPSGLALAPDGARLYVTCASPNSRVAELATRTGRLLRSLPAGHTALAPVISPDGQTLYVCNRFDHAVEVIGLAGHPRLHRIPVLREPVAAALTPDGRWLVVANHLQAGRADAANVAAAVSIIDTAAGRVLRHLALPNGSGLLRGVALSPDGRYAAVTHLLAHYYLPTTQVDRGWMNSNALSLLDLAHGEWRTTVLLDDLDQGAANPWAAAWTSDGKLLAVSHAGTHEVSLIDAPGLLAKLERVPPAPSLTTSASDPPQTGALSPPDDLAFLLGLRRRVALPGQGPRALTLAGGRLWVANYFSDNLSVIDPTAPAPTAIAVALSPPAPMSEVRRGESLFNDATLCFQGWQSCASCHSSDGRADGLNWDLLNDGIGNPKNTRSLLLSHRTPPAMAQGVRDSAETAVRAGLRHILFTEQPEAVPQALDAYLKSLAPVPSPYLAGGRLSLPARRGRRLFQDPTVGCANCHPPALFTNLQSYDVGTRAPFDTVGTFDTPTLVELWRTAPYLHDGSAATIQEVLTTRNPQDRHGHTAHLTPKQLEDLAIYLLSL